MKYTLDYTTRIPTRETKELSHGITSMDGLIFHVTRMGGNFRGILEDIPSYAYREILL